MKRLDYVDMSRKTYSHLSRPQIITKMDEIKAKQSKGLLGKIKDFFTDYSGSEEYFRKIDQKALEGSLGLAEKY